MLIELYEMLYSVEALPKTWSPIKIVQRKLLKDEIMARINIEINSRISEKN